MVGHPHTQRALNSISAKHVLRNGSIVLLFGLILILLTKGQKGWEVKLTIVVTFTSNLYAFLLNMDQPAGKNLLQSRKGISGGEIAFSCMIPITVASLVSLTVAILLSLSPGRIFLLMIL